MGKTSMQMAPAIIMTRAMDMAKMGRWMKKFTGISFLS
jgi:hypothetical protein